MIEPRRFVARWIAYGSVGALGFGVQFATLVLLTGWMEANYLLATAWERPSNVPQGRGHCHTLVAVLSQ